MAVSPFELGKRQPAEALVSTLREGERIAMRSGVVKSNGREHPIFVHDPQGIIKVGNENVVVWKAPKG